jgi:hypothetical protein
MIMDNANEFLVFGDAVRERASLDSQPVATIAGNLGASPAVAAKASWLASVYPAAVRKEVGVKILGDLRPSHLEAAAVAPEDVRSQLLLRAARDRLSVRALKRLAAERARGNGHATMAVSGGDDLARSARAVGTYLEFTDPQLRRLLAGPRGPVIRDLALVGAALAARIEGDTSTPQPNGAITCH